MMKSKWIFCKDKNSKLVPYLQLKYNVSVMLIVRPPINFYIWLYITNVTNWNDVREKFLFLSCHMQHSMPRNDETCFEYSFSFSFLQFELCLSFCWVGQEPIRYLKSLRGLKITDVASLSLWLNKSNFLF